MTTSDSTVPPRARSWQGWGWEDAALSDDQVAKLATAIGERFGIAPPAPVAGVPLDSVVLRSPRISPPASLAHLCSTDRRDRALHTYGRSYRDTVRLLRGELPQPPDVVARPADEADVLALIDWC